MGLTYNHIQIDVIIIVTALLLLLFYLNPQIHSIEKNGLESKCLQGHSKDDVENDSGSVPVDA